LRGLIVITTSIQTRAFNALMQLAGEKLHRGDHSMKAGSRTFKSQALIVQL
jgi:hypothetical protein